MLHGKSITNPDNNLSFVNSLVSETFPKMVMIGFSKLILNYDQISRSAIFSQNICVIFSRGRLSVNKC